MWKSNLSGVWESAIAVLEDNIFSSDNEKWEEVITDIEEAAPATSPHFPKAFMERRKEDRYLLTMPVMHRVKGQDKNWASSNSIDVSQNGVRLALNERVPIGTRMELHVKLPDNPDLIKLEGVVVWEQPSHNGQTIYECGVAFQNFRKLSHKEKIIHFMADRLCKFALKDNYGLTCRPATSKQDLIDAYHLVYKEYRARGYCHENDAELQYSYFCILPDTRTFVLEEKGKIVGTISLVVDSSCGLPMESIFADRVPRFRRPGRRLAEVSLLALDHRFFGKKSFSLTDFKKLVATFHLFKTMFDYANSIAGVTDLFIVMHPKHKDLYRYLHFDQIGPVRNYYGAAGNPACPMRLDIGDATRNIPANVNIRRYFLDTRPVKEKLQLKYPWDILTVEEFLAFRRPLWHTLKPEEQAFIKACYPGLSLR